MLIFTTCKVRNIQGMCKDITIRFAREDDAGTVFGLIKGIAEYEHLEDQVTATQELIRKNVFEDRGAEVLLAEDNGIVVGFALFFHSFSTFVGKPCLYLEDLFIKEESRGKGIGKMFFRKLAQIAVERDYERMDWCCLNWNQKSIDFYRHMGARPLEDWRIYRIDGDNLKKLSYE